MRIGVDGGCWANDRGYGRYARELLTEMVRIAPEEEFVFFLDPASRARFALGGDNVHVVEVAQVEAPTVAAASDRNRSPADMLRFTRAVWGTSLDVFFCPSVYTYFPIPPRLRAVVAIHDAIAERFPSRTLPSVRARLFWKAKVRLAVFQAKLVLTVSDFAAADLARILGVPRSRIRVAEEAPASVFRPSMSPTSVREIARRTGVPEGAQWFIYVGGFGPHKNLDVLVRAFGRSLDVGGSAVRPTYLVLVGKLSGDAFHVDTEEVHTTIGALGLEDRVLWPGFVDDEDLAHLYSGAVALVLPSDCEGFGLPAVEAAACGAPVVATTESPLPELLEGGGIFVEPRDEPALSEALARMLMDRDGREAMARTALEQAGCLSWERCAREALSAIREAAA